MKHSEKKYHSVFFHLGFTNYIGSLIQTDHNIDTYFLFCLVVLVVENSRKPFFICNVQKPGLFIFSFVANEQKRKKNNKKEKFHTLFFNMTQYRNEV